MEKEIFAKTATLAKFEQPKKIGLLENELTLENGEMTPTLKVKRKVVDARYKPVIDALYADEHEGHDGQH
jgi:long-chain acyl-CoA synthetase